MEFEKIIIESELEKVIEQNEHYFVVNKREIICVLPYTIRNGLLDNIGVIQKINEETEEEIKTLITGYLTKDDYTNLSGANRLLKDIVFLEIQEAERWIYLGELSMNQFSKSSFKIYGVDITGLEATHKEISNFELVELTKVTQSNDILFLSSYIRLFNYFYIKSLKHYKDEQTTKKENGEGSGNP